MKRALTFTVFGCAVVAMLYAMSPTFVVLARESHGWLQWAHDPQHMGTIDVVGQPINQKLADIVYDPFVSQEQAFAGGELLAHYQVPILDGQDVFMEFKTGSYPQTGDPYQSAARRIMSGGWAGALAKIPVAIG